MNELKIGIVSPYIPPDFAGAGKRAFNQANFLADNGYKIKILTTTKKNYEKENLGIISINGSKFSGNKGFLRKIRRSMEFLFLFIKFLKVINREKFDVIHCIPSESWFSLSSIIAAKLNGIKVVTETTLYGEDDPLSIRKSKLGLIKYKIFNLSDRIISLSPLLNDACKSAGIEEEKLSIIGNSVDTSRFKKVSNREKEILRTKLGLPPNKIILLYIGVIRSRKGVERLINTFYYLNNKIDNLCLVLAGPLYKDKENILYSNKMKKLVNDYGISSNVIFTGEIVNTDEYLKASDIFLFASKREGFGTAVIEAMSSGLPVVTYNIPKITEYIMTNRQNGFIVNNEQEMVRNIRKLIDNKDLYETLSKNARETVLNYFSVETIMKQYIDAYNRLVDDVK